MVPRRSIRDFATGEPSLSVAIARVGRSSIRFDTPAERAMSALADASSVRTRSLYSALSGDSEAIS